MSVPARRNPFCSRRPVRDEILHSSVKLVFPPVFGHTGDKKPENQARIHYIFTCIYKVILAELWSINVQVLGQVRKLQQVCLGGLHKRLRRSGEAKVNHRSGRSTLVCIYYLYLEYRAILFGSNVSSLKVYASMSSVDEGITV